MSRSVEEIVAGMTEAQREAVLASEGGFLPISRSLANIVHGLVEAGILRRRDHGSELDARLTPLSLSVRKHLEESHGR